MLANIVRVALLAELAAWAALVAWTTGRHGWPPAVAVAGAVAGAAGLRLALVLASLGLSWWWRSPRDPQDRLGLAGSLRLVAGEWRAMLANNLLWLPFERAVLRADPALASASRVPVILVHGYFSNRGTLCRLAKALDAAGIAPLFVPSLPAVFAPIETFAAHLDRVIGEVVAATGQPRVFLVCHSMGGLAARAWLRGAGAGRVAGLVTIGSPHHGTRLASLGLGRNARQMRLDSDFLRDLGHSERASPPGVPALSVYTVHDNLVAPQASSRLDWAASVAIHGVAHLNMLADSRVHAAVLEALAGAAKARNS